MGKIEPKNSLSITPKVVVSGLRKLHRFEYNHQIKVTSVKVNPIFKILFLNKNFIFLVACST